MPATARSFADRILLAIEDGRDIDANCFSAQAGLGKVEVSGTVTEGVSPGDSCLAPAGVQALRQGYVAEAFAKTADKALRAIKVCTRIMTLENGEIVLPRDTQKMIENAASKANTDGERLVVFLLKRPFEAKLNTNLSKAIDMQTESLSENNGRSKSKAAVHPAICYSGAKQHACALALGTILRNYNFLATPEKCTHLTLDLKDGAGTGVEAYWNLKLV